MTPKGKSNRKKLELQILKIKRAAMLLLGFSFFFFPGQNYYLTIESPFRPNNVRPLTVMPPAPALYPVNFTGVKPPSLTAQSILVMDRKSVVVMFAKNEKVWLLPASTVKIMTALVSLDQFGLEQVLTVKEINPLGQKMDLIEGEKISVKSLLYGLLVYSANDAAWTLAQNYPGGEEAFMKMMNQKAEELNLKDSYFASPTGIDSDEKGNLLDDYSYTTALDLARLTSWALENPVFKQVVETREIEVTDVTGQFKHRLFNVNQLLGKIEGLKGVKTGWTESAGECLVSYTERNGEELITVILGSQDRFGETAKLIDWAFSNFRLEDLTPSI